MQNAALKVSGFQAFQKDGHFTLYPIRDDVEAVLPKADETAPLLQKENRCCDEATD